MVSDLTGILNQILSTWLIVEVRRVTQIEDTATVIAITKIVQRPCMEVLCPCCRQVEFPCRWNMGSADTPLITGGPIEVRINVKNSITLQVAPGLHQMIHKHSIRNVDISAADLSSP